MGKNKDKYVTFYCPICDERITMPVADTYECPVCKVKIDASRLEYNGKGDTCPRKK